MNALLQHLSRCFIAGIVALLPIGGLVLSTAYLEKVLSESWLAEQPFYFPGLGILLGAAIIYGVGLTVSTFLGRWLWGLVDRVLESLPILGSLYQTLKQILGYGEGKEGLFQEVVLVRSRDTESAEIGLVTQQVDGDQVTVFLPGSPNPTTGRLLVIDRSQLSPMALSVKDALSALVAVGKTDAWKKRLGDD